MIYGPIYKIMMPLRHVHTRDLCSGKEWGICTITSNSTFIMSWTVDRSSCYNFYISIKTTRPNIIIYKTENNFQRNNQSAVVHDKTTINLYIHHRS